MRRRQRDEETGVTEAKATQTNTFNGPDMKSEDISASCANIETDGPDLGKKGSDRNLLCLKSAVLLLLLGYNL